MRLAVYLVAALLLYAGLRYAAGRSMYFPFRYPQGDWSAQTALGAADLWLTASDGVRLHAWWIESPGSTLATLHLHGNGGNLTHRAPVAQEIARAGSSVLLLDYRGYGRSEGRPTERGLYRDAEAAYRWLLDRGYPPSRIVLHGESLGTAVAVDLAARQPSAGVILEAPFTSARDVAHRVLPWIGPLLVSGYDARVKIANVRAPVLIVHGDRDEIIHYDFGKKLFEAASEPKEFAVVPDAGHNNLLEVSGPEYVERLRRFYARLDQ
ncbi:MAG: alpha/beta hydrolase [Bryobacteraceae bacterium]